MPKATKPTPKAAPAKAPVKQTTKSQPAAKAKNDTPPDTLARSLIVTLPVAAKIVANLQSVADLMPQLERELQQARKDGHTTLARAYVVLHRLQARAKDMLKVSDSGKVFGPLVQQYSTVELPQAFEQAGVPHVVLDEGFRVGVNTRFQASIKPDQKDAAYEWLRDNGLPDLITEVVNASTLSAAAKREIEENNRDFPEELFTIAQLPNVSVTKT
jgi:hypothetical protein